MYTIDENDQVIELEGFPQSSVGAPIPVIVSDEHTSVIAFYLQDTPDDWDGTWIRVMSLESDGEPIAIVRFSLTYAFYFGAPNDEAFSGHPLASKGLSPYGAYEVKNSSWIRQLEKMNSVHEHHKPDRFWRRKHFILTFHDSTFECVADGYEIEICEGSIKNVFPKMLTLLDKKAT